MWAVAGALLGFVALASLLGFHVGPHSHLAAGIVGVFAAAWLVVMAATGRAEPLLWVALSADVVLTVGVGTAAVRGLRDERAGDQRRLGRRLTGAEGVATSDLDPNGTVRVHGEVWSATSLNGTIPSGATIQVVESGGVRLKVWGELATPTATPIPPFELEKIDPTGRESEEQRTETS